MNQARRHGPLTPLVVAHADLMVAWLGLYLMQSWLAATARLSVHRRLGTAAVLIAAAVVVTGYRATVEMARRGFDLNGIRASNSRIGVTSSSRTRGRPSHVLLTFNDYQQLIGRQENIIDLLGAPPRVEDADRRITPLRDPARPADLA